VRRLSRQAMLYSARSKSAFTPPRVFYRSESDVL